MDTAKATPPSPGCFCIRADGRKFAEALLRYRCKFKRRIFHFTATCVDSAPWSPARMRYTREEVVGNRATQRRTLAAKPIKECVAPT